MARRPHLPTVLTAALVAVAASLTLGSLSAAPAPAAAQERVSAPEIRVYDYDLGDKAFQLPGFNAYNAQGVPGNRPAPIELVGRVYAPADAAGRALPVVVIAHGLFWTCADEASGRTSGDWPCRGRLEPIESERGYDYLGHTLAARDLVVISISADGINAGELGEVADRARGRLVFAHLRMWRDLVSGAASPLAGAFTDAGTGQAVAPDFRGAADLANVGLVGHSRGGRGMMWAAADRQRERVPEGVGLRAVFGLAAAGPAFMDRRARPYTVSGIPLMTWAGTCDATGRDEYNLLAQRRGNPVNLALTVQGANHNNLNARWAKRSGLPGAEDDAVHPPGRPGKCRTDDPDELDDTLGYRAEQRIAAVYMEAFFTRYLRGDTSFDGVLAGTSEPVPDPSTVDVRVYPPE